jgi:hypothetical protein
VSVGGVLRCSSVTVVAEASEKSHVRCAPPVMGAPWTAAWVATDGEGRRTGRDRTVRAGRRSDAAERTVTDVADEGPAGSFRMRVLDEG